MIQRLLALLPTDLSALTLAITIAGAAIGLVLWLGGSRFHRTVITLVSVSSGALLGLRMPGWFGWGIEGWATGVLGALALGISGYLVPKVWVGIGLGMVLAVWAAVAVTAMDATARSVAWPAEQGMPLLERLSGMWEQLTPDTRRLLPFACGSALISGFSFSLLWPRLGMVLLYSGAGLSLLLGLGLAALNSSKKEWLNLIPRQTSSQVIVLFSLAAFGAILQWRCVPASAARRRVRPQAEF